MTYIKQKGRRVVRLPGFIDMYFILLRRRALPFL